MFYWAVRELGKGGTLLAKQFKMSQPGVVYAVNKGDRIAKEINLRCLVRPKFYAKRSHTLRYLLLSGSVTLYDGGRLIEFGGHMNIFKFIVYVQDVSKSDTNRS